MIAITVSTNYDDILNMILPQNAPFFNKWYIITHIEDKATKEVIKKYNFNNVECLYYNFYANNKVFNKGGAIKNCQLYLSSLNYEGDILLLDSDIYLPDNFNEIINKKVIKENTLYGPEKRLDYHSLESFHNDKVDDNVYKPEEFLGFFQLYKNNKKLLYKDSENCSQCDLDFIDLFKDKIIIDNLIVKHLGKARINWDGRKLDIEKKKEIELKRSKARIIKMKF